MTEPRVSLHRACRVRKERFGLLFYDSRGPRLLFAETGDLLEPGFFTGEVSAEETLDRLTDAEHRKVTGLLSHLAKKGFIREQQIC
jgi:putative mycofactocin binding protein MftB